MKKLFALLMIAALACAGAALAEGPLPAYTYTGSDAIEGAVAAYIVSDMSENFASEEGCVTIPAPVILKVEQIDDSHVKVYGDFWGFNYVLDGKVLETISGGEAPGIMTLEKSGDAWTVTAVETAGDGTDFAADIERFSQGDKELEDKYFDASDGMAPATAEVIRRFIRDYVNANGLAVAAYQDPYWPPVPLEDAGERGPITGNIVDGGYEVTVPVLAGDTGDWNAVISANSADRASVAWEKREKDHYSVRFTCAADGQTAVYLEYVDRGVVSELHSFDLKAEGGKVLEVTGGFYTASPDPKELEPRLLGEWHEHETQFTKMTIAKNPFSGWDVEIVSPVSHGSFVFKATMNYDCSEDRFLYSNGCFYDIPLTESGAYELTEPKLENSRGGFTIIPANDGKSFMLKWESGVDFAPAVGFVRSTVE